jgi:hypothetical protein
MTAIKQIKPQEQQDWERNMKLIRFWKTGNYSQAALGRMFKISRERVRTIVNRYEKENEQ